MTLFPSHGDSREDQERAKRLAFRLRDVVQAALFARDSGAAVRLDVRVSRRATGGRVGHHCIILHRIHGARNARASGDWPPWSWPLTDFTQDDWNLLYAGQIPASVLPCVLDWSARLRTPSPDPKVTV